MAYGKKRGMYKKRSTRSRTSSSNTKKGLTKKEKTQVKTIAKKAVVSMAESKYFNTNSAIANRGPVPIWNDGTRNSSIYCYGYATGRNQDLNTATASNINYGVSPVNGQPNQIGSLNLNFVFTENNPIPQRAQFAPDGVTVRPSYAESQWVLERPMVSTQVDPELGAVYRIRMIRCRPRTAKLAYQPADPRFDLFVDAINEPMGIGTTNDSGVPTFDVYEFDMAKTNSRRYQILEDKVFDLACPASYVNTSIGAGEFITTTAKSGCYKMKLKHDIGKELYYPQFNDNSDSANQYPSTGFEPEFIFFHIRALGSVNTGTAGVTANNIRLSCRPVSTFKDL